MLQNLRRCPSGRQESLEADLALNRLRLLVDLELRLGGAAGKLCVALALLRSLGSVSTTHFVLCVLERKGEAVGCKLVLAQRTRFIVELGVCRGGLRTIGRVFSWATFFNGFTRV